MDSSRIDYENSDKQDEELNAHDFQNSASKSRRKKYKTWIGRSNLRIQKIDCHPLIRINVTQILGFAYCSDDAMKL